MKRRITVLILCAVLLLAAAPLAAMAASSPVTMGLSASAAQTAAGDTFTVSITSEGTQNAADVLITYDSSLVTYVSAAKEPQYAGAGRILILDVDTDAETINTLTFKANENVTALSHAVFTMEHAKYAESLEAMTLNAKDAVMSPSSVTVDILPKFTVTFSDENGVLLDTQTVVYGGKAVAPEDRTLTGYTFKGWNDGTETLSKAAIDAKAVTAATAYQAKFAINTYTVSFSDETGKLIESQTVEYGQNAEAPDDPEKTGYTFLGWNDGTDTLSKEAIDGKPVKAAAAYQAVYALSLKLTQNVDYVGGYVRVLITEAELPGYTLDGEAMYRLTDNTFAYLYKPEDKADLPTDAEILAKLAAAEATDAAHDLSAQYGTGDVNYTAENADNTIDIADARAAFNCENVTYSVADYMDVYLRSDVNHDAVVDSDDVDIILGIIKDGYDPGN